MYLLKAASLSVSYTSMLLLYISRDNQVVVVVGFYNNKSCSGSKSHIYNYIYIYIHFLNFIFVRSLKLSFGERAFLLTCCYK